MIIKDTEKRKTQRQVQIRVPYKLPQKMLAQLLIVDKGGGGRDGLVMSWYLYL